MAAPCLAAQPTLLGRHSADASTGLNLPSLLNSTCPSTATADRCAACAHPARCSPEPKAMAERLQGRAGRSDRSIMPAYRTRAETVARSLMARAPLGWQVHGAGGCCLRALGPKATKRTAREARLAAERGPVRALLRAARARTWRALLIREPQRSEMPTTPPPALWQVLGSQEVRYERGGGIPRPLAAVAARRPPCCHRRNARSEGRAAAAAARRRRRCWRPWRVGWRPRCPCGSASRWAPSRIISCDGQLF